MSDEEAAREAEIIESVRAINDREQSARAEADRIRDTELKPAVVRALKEHRVPKLRLADALGRDPGTLERWKKEKPATGDERRPGT